MSATKFESGRSSLMGHNVQGMVISVEVRFFNSLARYSGCDGLVRRLEMQAGASIGDLIDMFKLPVRDVFLVMRNGKDINAGIYQGGAVDRGAEIDDGDVIAFSGPVPYSWGYGAPVV